MTFPVRWWRQPEAQDAFWLSWVSLVCTLVAAIGGVVGFSKTESTLILAFGLENFVDFISSVVVLWRFYCPNGCDEAYLAKLQKREERASLAISIIIGLLGLFVFSIGILDMMKMDKDMNLSLLVPISFISIIVFGSLTIIKFKYASDLKSASLYKDGICSLIGTSLSASLLLTAAVIDSRPNAWYIDPVVSLVLGISAMFYGFRVVVQYVQNGVPILHPELWCTKNDVANQEVELQKNSNGDYEGGITEISELGTNGSVDYEGGKSTEEKDDEHGVI